MDFRQLEFYAPGTFIPYAPHGSGWRTDGAGYPGEGHSRPQASGHGPPFESKIQASLDLSAGAWSRVSRHRGGWLRIGRFGKTCGPTLADGR